MKRMLIISLLLLLCFGLTFTTGCDITSDQQSAAQSKALGDLAAANRELADTNSGLAKTNAKLVDIDGDMSSHNGWLVFVVIILVICGCFGFIKSAVGKKKPAPSPVGAEPCCRETTPAVTAARDTRTPAQIAKDDRVKD